MRDQLLGIQTYDRDWVVIGANPQIMKSLNFKPIGKDFPVYLHPQTGEEYALARKETKSGRGYKGFSVDTSPDVSLVDDLYRRDLTINAMAMDGDGVLIDPFGGKQDLENKRLRHVSEHFAEDPLRVLRVARFAGRFANRGFVVDKSTMELMKQMSGTGELSDLVAERVWQEVYRALRQDLPSVFFFTLRDANALESVLPQVDQLLTEQRTNRNSEPMRWLDAVANLTDNVVYRYCVIAHSTGQLAKHRLYNSDPSANHERLESEAINTVEKMCGQLRVPGKFHNLSVKITRFLDTFNQLHCTQPSAIVEMMLAINALRDPKQFQNFCDACDVLLQAKSDIQDDVRKSVKLFEQCRVAMLQVNEAQLAEKYSGAQLQARIYDSRVAAVRSVL